MGVSSVNPGFANHEAGGTSGMHADATRLNGASMVSSSAALAISSYRPRTVDLRRSWSSAGMSAPPRAPDRTPATAYTPRGISVRSPSMTSATPSLYAPRVMGSASGSCHRNARAYLSHAAWPASSSSMPAHSATRPAAPDPSHSAVVSATGRSDQPDDRTAAVRVSMSGMSPSVMYRPGNACTDTR